MSFRGYKLPINYILLLCVAGPTFVRLLSILKITHILDVNAYLRGGRSLPEIGSIFLFGNDLSSYEFTYGGQPELTRNPLRNKVLGDISIKNGTLSRLINLNTSQYYDLINISKLYYLAHTGNNLITEL